MSRVLCCLLGLACSALLLNAVVGGEDAKKDVPAKTTAEIERLIKQLGDDDFYEREKASKALEAVGELAREALWQAADAGGDAEVRVRAEKLVEALDAKTYCELHSFKGHTSDVGSVAFSPDGKRALSGSHDKSVRLWDLETGKELRHTLQAIQIESPAWPSARTARGCCLAVGTTRYGYGTRRRARRCAALWGTRIS